MKSIRVHRGKIYQVEQKVEKRNREVIVLQIIIRFKTINRT